MIKKDRLQNLNFEVDAIQVVESQLKKTGPKYTLLESI
jgi:2'-5' RNA ligase